MMLSQLASKKTAKLMYADVSRAYFYAKAVRPVYVVLPQEDKDAGDEDMCGELVMSMYGTRDGALNWSTEYSDTLLQSGYRQGQSNACLFHNEKLDVSILVHGDDFVAVGSDQGLEDAKATLQGKYKLKVQTLGNGPDCVSEVRILNKVVRYTSKGVELEADPRHAELVVRELWGGSCRTTKVPGSKATGERSETRVIKPSKNMEASAMDGESSEGEMAQVEKENEDKDDWINEGEDGIWRSRHKPGRRGLFTPRGTKGSPKSFRALGARGTRRARTF